MMRPSIVKVIRDLKTDYVKSLLLVLAIAIGVFGIGSILGGYAVLTREMSRNYLGTEPASATIKINNSDIDLELLGGVEKIPGVLRAERHATITARMKIGQDWYPLLLFVIDDFNDIKTNRFSRISGAWPPPPGTMLVERTAFRVMKTGEGGSVTIKTPQGEEKIVSISGTVHDPGLAPAWQEQTGYGYITLSTLHGLGERQGFDELRVTMADGEGSLKSIEGKSDAIVQWIEGQGHKVLEVQIPPPRRHPHQGQMNAVLMLFVVFSFMTLILSAILVATSISTLMTKQIREIGVMKTIGAGSLQIAALYLLMLLIVCILAVVPSIHLGKFSAGMMVKQISGLLNIEIFDASIPHWVPLVQAAAGILIPLAAAAFPVLLGSRITVQEALNNYGVHRNDIGKGCLESFLAKVGIFGATCTLSLRNIFRNRPRLVMTLGLLAAGGALFMTALNLSKAWEVSLQKIYQYRRYDLEVRLNQPFPADRLIKKIRELPGTKEVEAWGHSPTSIRKGISYDIVRTYPDKGHGSFVLLGLPVPTKLVNFPLLGGRWLSPGGSNEVVLNHMAQAQAPHLKVGDVVSLSLDDRPSEWKIVGFVEDIGSPATAYVSAEAFAEVQETRGSTNMLRISLASRDRDTILQKTREIEEVMAREGAAVDKTIPISMLRTAMGEHMEVLVRSLLAMALLMAAVGALGLMSTMGIAIMERTRELGVMRAIGATPLAIGRLVVMEGTLIGALSLFFAFPLSLVLSSSIGNLIGSMSFKTPLPLTISTSAFIAWSLMVLSGSIVATIYPARRASRITTREALAYQ